MSLKFYELLKSVYELEKVNVETGKWFPETFEQWLNWIDNGF